MLQNLLAETSARITALEALQGEFALPNTGTPDAVIKSYLEYRQEQRGIKQQFDDMNALRDMVQAEIDRIEAEKLAAKQKADAEERARFIDAETKRITGELANLEPTSPEASRLLLELSNLRRG